MKICKWLAGQRCWQDWKMFGDPCVLARIVDYGMKRWWYRRMTNKGVNSMRYMYKQRFNFGPYTENQQGGQYNGMALQLRDIRRFKFKMKEHCKWEVTNLTTAQVMGKCTRMKARGVAPATDPTNDTSKPRWLPGTIVLAAFNDYDRPPELIKDLPGWNYTVSGGGRVWPWQGPKLTTTNAIDVNANVFPVPSDNATDQYFYWLRKWDADRYFNPLKLLYADAEGAGQTAGVNVSYGNTSSALPADYNGGTTPGIQQSQHPYATVPDADNGVFVPYDPKTTGDNTLWGWDMYQNVGYHMLNDNVPNAAGNLAVTNPLLNYLTGTQNGDQMFLEQYTQVRRGEIDKVYKRRTVPFRLNPGQKFTTTMNTMKYGGTIANLQKAANPWVLYEANGLGGTHPLAATQTSGSAAFTGTNRLWGQFVNIYTNEPDNHPGRYEGLSFSEMNRRKYPICCPTTTEYCSWEFRGTTMPLVAASQIANAANVTELGPGEVLIKKRYRAFVTVYMGKRNACEKFNQRGRLAYNRTSTYNAQQTSTTGYANTYPTAAATTQPILWPF